MRTLVEVEPPTDEADLPRRVVDIIVEIRGVRPGGYEHDNERVRLAGFLPALPHPLGELPAIRRITKDSCPPHDLLNPSSSFVKKRPHLAFSGVAHGSRLK